MAFSVSIWLRHWPTHYFRKATFRAHVSKWWPAGEMWLATSFYVAREAKILILSLSIFLEL